MVELEDMRIVVLDDLDRSPARGNLTDVGDRLVDFGRRHRLERLALFQRQQADQVVAMLLQRVGVEIQIDLALVVAEHQPVPERCLGRSDGRIELLALTASARARTWPVTGLMTSKLSFASTRLPVMWSSNIGHSLRFFTLHAFLLHAASDHY